MGPGPSNLATVFTDHLDLPAPSDALDQKALPAHGGVYAFSDEGDRLIQTVSAQNLRRSAMGRLEPPNDEVRARRADLRTVARRIWWRPTYSVFEGKLAYLEIARRLNPGSYRKDLAFGPAWFATIQPGDRLPRWRVDSRAFAGGAVDVGPFERRNRCTEFVALLEDLFDLCREHHILEQAPRGEPCAYFEMGKCGAPCDGSISLGRYRGMIESSVRFATGMFDERLGELEEAMRRAAGDRAYARAARLKESVMSARNFIARCKSAVARVDDFRYLIVQRGETRSRVKAFVVDRGLLSVLPSVAIKSFSDVAFEWVDRIAARLPDDGTEPALRSERVWLVSHFLAKRDSAPGLFRRACDVTTPDNLTRAVVAALGQKKKTNSDKRSNRHHTIDPNR